MSNDWLHINLTTWDETDCLGVAGEKLQSQHRNLLRTMITCLFLYLKHPLISISRRETVNKGTFNSIGPIPTSTTVPPLLHVWRLILLAVTKRLSAETYQNRQSDTGLGSSALEDHIRSASESFNYFFDSFFFTQFLGYLMGRGSTQWSSGFQPRIVDV